MDSLGEHFLSLPTFNRQDTENVSSSISLQNPARCTAEFKPNCWQQSQTVRTKWCLLASYTPGRFPGWLGSELENCQASTKCRLADTNRSSLLYFANLAGSQAGTRECCVHQLRKKLHSVHALRCWQQRVAFFCCGPPNLKVFQSSPLCGRIQKWIPSSGSLSWVTFAEQGQAFSDKGSPALWFCSFKNWWKYFVEVGFLRWKGHLSPSGSLVKLCIIVWVNAHLGM